MFFPTIGKRFEWMNDALSESATELLPKLRARHFPTIDHITGMGLSDDPTSRDDEFDVRLESAKSLLGALEPGITHFTFHPSVETPELRAICPNWRSRVGDEQVFRSPELRQFLIDQGIHVIGYRPLKNLIS
jgi:chitin disaccharide deacetylase